MSTTPELGWAGTIGMVVIILALVVGVVLYHVWMERRVRRERHGRMGGS